MGVIETWNYSPAISLFIPWKKMTSEIMRSLSTTAQRLRHWIITLTFLVYFSTSSYSWRTRLYCTYVGLFLNTVTAQVSIKKKKGLQGWFNSVMCVNDLNFLPNTTLVKSGMPTYLLYITCLLSQIFYFIFLFDWLRTTYLFLLNNSFITGALRTTNFD